LSTDSRGFSIVGTSVHRVDGVDKVTGRAKYAGDLIVPGMIEGKFLRSPYAHARIRAIDTREAEALSGVIAVLTSKDLSDIEPYIGRGKNKDQPIIAIDRVIYAGQPVAAVAALDRSTAEAALSKIHVDYEELPAVIDVDEAIADGAPAQPGFDVGLRVKLAPEHLPVVPYVGGGGSLVTYRLIEHGDFISFNPPAPDVTTGNPDANASSTGNPKPS